MVTHCASRGAFADCKGGDGHTALLSSSLLGFGDGRPRQLCLRDKHLKRGRTCFSVWDRKVTSTQVCSVCIVLCPPDPHNLCPALGLPASSCEDEAAPARSLAPNSTPKPRDASNGTFLLVSGDFSEAFFASCHPGPQLAGRGCLSPPHQVL